MEYAGSELETFALAHNWKSYVRSILAEFITGRVLEVGAGLGETTKALRPGADCETWTCIEPDAEMGVRLSLLAGEGALGPGVAVHVGTLADIERATPADTVLYVDVLEHIEDDRAELLLAASRLRSGGRIVVLSPAFPFLYSEFDKAIGHFRRYTKAMLRRIAPPSMREERAVYLDSVGLFASAANRLFLRQDLPTVRQIRTWDRLVVRCRARSIHSCAAPSAAAS